MDNLTIDKTAAAVLSSLLLLTAANTLVDMAYPTGRNASKEERRLDAPMEKEASGVKAAPEPPSAVALLSSADSAEGEKLAKKCEVCHSFKQGGAAKIGPELYDIVGRKVASVPGFGYSPALKAKGGEWTYEELDAWLKNPGAAVPGSKMAFAGGRQARRRGPLCWPTCAR
jgi:cytochrome c